MTAGFQPTLVNINNQAANVAVNVRNSLQAANLFQTWLLSFGIANVEALGMSTADGNVLASAMTDLNDIWSISQGLASAHLTGTYNYQQFAKQLTGYI